MNKSDVAGVYWDLHAMPELGFEEVRTSAYLAREMRNLGYEVTEGYGGTGVLGIMRGSEPGPVLLLRADMDALPFANEDGTIERIHACGHDAHSAMLLCTAAELVGKVRKGTLKVLFQPAEETIQGALACIKEGVLDDVDIALGMHVRPVQDIPAGTMCAAVRHTSTGKVFIEIKGRGAHASRPHLGINCAEVAAVLTNAICAIKLNPNKSWSCKVTSIEATAAAANIIPEEGLVKLDVRAQDNEMMDEMIAKIGQIANGIAASFGATVRLYSPYGPCPAAVLDDDLTAEVAEVIRQEIGEEKLAGDCGGGGEDFHYFKKFKPEIKAAYFGVGAGCTPGLHSRNMTLDPSHLPNGVKVMTAMALRKIG